MKILLVSRRYPPHPARGSAFTVQRLAETLAQGGVEVVVINTPDIPEMKTRWHNGVRIYDIPFPTVPSLRQVRSENTAIAKNLMTRIHERRREVIGSIVEIIKSEAPTIVHTMTTSFPPAAIWKAAKQSGIPVVHTLQLHSLLCRKEQMFDKGRRCERPCCDACRQDTENSINATQWVDAVVGCSQFMTDRHLEFGLFKNAKIKTAIFNSTPANPLAKRIRPPSEPLQIGFLGQISADKGVGWLVRQMARLPKRNWHLWLAGRGPRRNENILTQRLKPLPANHIGYQDAQKFLTHIDLLVVPSMWDEPFGLVAIESLAAGTPILVAERGGLTEIAEASGRAAETFDPAKPQTFHQKMRQILNASHRFRDPALHAACRLTAEKFSPNRMAEEYLAVYRQLL